MRLFRGITAASDSTRRIYTSDESLQKNKQVATTEYDVVCWKRKREIEIEKETSLSANHTQQIYHVDTAKHNYLDAILRFHYHDYLPYNIR